MENNIAVFYSRSVFQLTSSSHSRFNELLRMAKILKDSCIEGELLLPGFTNLIGDSWYAFYAREPSFKEEARQLDGMQFDFLTNLLNNEEYSRWHQLTKGDELLSVLTAIGMADQLKKSLEDAKKSGVLNDDQNAHRSKAFAEKQLEEIRKKQKEPALSQTMKDSLKRQQQIYEERKKSAIQQLKGNEQQSREYIQQLTNKMIGSMIENNKDKVRNTKKAVITVGTMDGKKFENLPLNDQFELAEILGGHKELRKIADMVGRFKRIAMKKQKTKHKQTMERKNITIGQEVSRLLPTELASYILPHSKLDFLRRYSEQQTFIFDTKGKDRKGKGPIIICMDESSSMTSMKEQSKAFCIALLMIAKKQKRDFAIIPFASQVGELQIFRKGQATTQELIQFSNSFLSGGTNYEHPLRESLNILLQSEFNEADVLFVTDGSSFLPSKFIDEFNETKKKKQFECTAIVLTNLYNAVDLNVVNKFSERVIEVNELFEADEAFII